MHIGLDADAGQIVAAALTNRDVDDASQVEPLLDQVTGAVASFIANGAYDDQGSTYDDVAQRHPEAAVVVPPRSTAVPSDMAETEPT